MCCAVVTAVWVVAACGSSEDNWVGLEVTELGAVCVLTPGLADLI